MKILYLFSTAETSVAIVTLNQIKALRYHYPDIELKIACVNYYSERSILENENILKKKKYNNKFVNQIKSIQFVYNLKKEFNPDFTISNLGAVNAYNCLLGKDDLKVCIFHSPFKQFKAKGIVSRVLNYLSIKYIYNRASAIIGISTEVVNDLRVNLPNANILLSYNLHNIEVVKCKAKEDLEFNVGEKKNFELLCLGNIDRNKCQDLIIKSLVLLEKNEYHLFVVGKVVDVEYYNELLNFIENHNLEKNVSFIPFLSNPYPLLKRVDVLVSSSISEGLPGVIIESLLLNTPVVCSDSSLGIWEILSKDKIDGNLNDIVRAKKGLIVPNPGVLSSEKYIELLSKAIRAIVGDYESFVKSDFDFEEKIDFESIHLFYNVLQQLKNENIN